MDSREGRYGGLYGNLHTRVELLHAPARRHEIRSAARRWGGDSPVNRRTNYWAVRIVRAKLPQRIDSGPRVWPSDSTVDRAGRRAIGCRVRRVLPCPIELRRPY